MPMQHDLSTQNVQQSTQGSERVDARSLVGQCSGSIAKTELKLQNLAHYDPLDVIEKRRSEVLQPADKI